MNEETSAAERRSYWEFSTPSRIVFGRNAVTSLGRVLKKFGAQRVLLVTDRVLSELGAVQRVDQQVRCARAELLVFDEGEPEPSTDLCCKLAERAREWQPDIWLALGGGSNMDLAKMSLALATYPADPADYFGFDKIPGPLPPLICLPTTAGTGSEVSHAAVIKVSRTGQKGGVVSDHLRPAVACVDQAFTDTCPHQLTAESGFDALTHAIEARLAAPYRAFIDDVEHGLPYQGNHPLGTSMAEQAIALIGKSLPRVLEVPSDRAARDDMALAATLAGLAFSSCGVSLVHALEYWIGSKYSVAHGVGNAILLPAVLRFYQPESAMELARIGRLVAVPGLDDCGDEQEQAGRTIEYLESLRERAGLPGCLRDIGANQSDLPALARAASTLQHLVQLAPKRTRRKDLLSILEDAF